MGRSSIKRTKTGKGSVTARKKRAAKVKQTSTRAKQSRAGKSRAAKPKFYKSRFIPVYSKLPDGAKAGKTNLSRFSGKQGVYIIRERVKSSGRTRIVYIGKSYPEKIDGKLTKANLYKTIIRHFQEWTRQDERGIRQGGVTFVEYLKTRVYSVQVTVTKSKVVAKALEKMLIQKYKQRGTLKNSVLYEEFEATEKEDDILDFWESETPVNYDELDDPPF